MDLTIRLQVTKQSSTPLTFSMDQWKPFFYKADERKIKIGQLASN